MPKTKRPKSVVGERLERARLNAGYKTQKGLARAVGLEGLTIWRVETGGYPLSKDTASRLAPVLGVSEAWLMYGADGPASEAKGHSAEKIVRQYLASELGEDTPPEVSQRLMIVDYSTLGIPKPGVKEVHRVREMIEFNLALGRKRPT